MIDIQKFCYEPRDGRDELWQPFNQGGFTNASNGHLIIRVPVMSEYQDQEKPDLTKHDKWFSAEPEAWFKCPEITEPELGLCQHCWGEIEMFVCPECLGSGRIDFQTKYNDYVVECELCDESGQLRKGEIEALSNWHTELKKYDKKEPCNNCGGTGKQAYIHKDIEVGGLPFSDLYLSWLCQLPNCEIGPFGEKEPARIRFDGGEGLIMPRRKD